MDRDYYEDKFSTKKSTKKVKKNKVDFNKLLSNIGLR